MDSMNGDQCPGCPEAGKLTCAGCQNVKYCSTECQQAEWPTHKSLCKTFKNFQTRPADNMRRIIYFPPKGKPQFMWRPVKNGGGYQTVGMGELMGANGYRPFFIKYNTRTHQHLDHLISFHYADEFMKNYPEPNKAVVTATDGKLDFLWGGPVFAECGYTRMGKFDIVQVKDMDMGAFADVVDALQCYNNDTMEHKARHGAKVEAVKMNCPGEQRVYGQPPFKTVKIPRHHPVFDVGATSMISERIGIPALALFKYPDNPKFTDGHDHNNSPATFMMSCCELDAKHDWEKSVASFGWVPRKWLAPLPNVLVARKDRQNLSLEVAEAFAAYCEYHLVAHFQYAGETEAEVGDGTANARALAEITPQKWAVFVKQFRVDRKIRGGREMRESDLDTLIDGVARMGMTEMDRDRIEYCLFRSEDNASIADDSNVTDGKSG